MKNKKLKQNNSGIRVCDSIVMSVKNKKMDLRLLESVIIAIAGYISTIMVFFTMFDFNYNKSPVIISAVIFSAIHIFLSSFKKIGIWFISGSIVVTGIIFWKKMEFMWMFSPLTMHRRMLRSRISLPGSW